MVCVCAHTCVSLCVYILYISALCVMISWKMGWGFSALSKPIYCPAYTTGSFIWETWLVTAVVYDFQLYAQVCVCVSYHTCGVVDKSAHWHIILIHSFSKANGISLLYIFDVIAPQNVFGVFHYSPATGAWVPCSMACWLLLLRTRRALHILPPCAGSDNAIY